MPLSKTRPLGYAAIVLHAHLPFVRHPEKRECLEELWLMEAITETYIPLLLMMEELLAKGIDFRLTMSITPTLAAMLNDALLQKRYSKHLVKLLDLGEKEAERTKNQPRLQRVVHMYQNRLQKVQSFFHAHNGQLLNVFRQIADTGKLEILASAATHGYLPLLYANPKAVEAQIAIGITAYKKYFSEHPKGFWLPECGFTSGIDEILAKYGVKYFIADSHGLLHGNPPPPDLVYAPIYTPHGVAVFGRDWESSKQVWSATEGYPGDFDYRDFYRDIGFDLDRDYIGPYLVDDIRGFTGMKYHKITGSSGHKAIYDPVQAGKKAIEHAGNFMFNRELQIKHLAANMERPPLIVAPYDAELFGHWWYEGPEWLKSLFTKSCRDQNIFTMVTLGEYIDKYPIGQVSAPADSSWGMGGYHEVWLDHSNAWIYRHLHAAAERMGELANRYPHAVGVKKRALDQAARELLLAQSSDWAFIMKTGTMVEYAVHRTKTHLLNFTTLYEGVLAGHIDEDRLRVLEGFHNVFPDLDYSIYAFDDPAQGAG